MSPRPWWHALGPGDEMAPAELDGYGDEGEDDALVICGRCGAPCTDTRRAHVRLRARARPGLSRLAQVGLAAASLADARGSDSITPDDIALAARTVDA